MFKTSTPPPIYILYLTIRRESSEIIERLKTKHKKQTVRIIHKNTPITLNLSPHQLTQKTQFLLTLYQPSTILTQKFTQSEQKKLLNLTNKTPSLTFISSKPYKILSLPISLQFQLSSNFTHSSFTCKRI